MFMVGAGVSRVAGLPLFGDLADQVYEQLGQGIPGTPGSLAGRAEEEAREARQYDRLIGLLEQRLVYRGVDWRQPRNTVREAVVALVKPGRGADFSAHADLLDLSRGPDGRPRIVTTNFDTIFERVWRRRNDERLPSSAGQCMPAVGSHDFTGVLHLHGRIADRRSGLAETDLVLSSANFGEAYMRSGWASQIVYDLLRRYTLVLVGYSADDPPMRYMLEATEEGRINFPDLKPAYAFVADEFDNSGPLREAWRGKGLQPLIFPAPQHDYTALYRTLHAWADMVRDAIGWSEDEIGRIAAVRHTDSPGEDRSKFAFLVTELSSPDVAARHAADPAWIEALYSDGQIPDDWTYVAWFRHRLQSADAARYAAGANDEVKASIARAVSLLLRTQRDPLPEPFRQFWLLFVQAYGQTDTHPYGLMRECAPVTTNRIRETVAAVEPRLRVERRFSWHEFEEPEPEPEPRTIHDLAHFSFHARERDWHRWLQRWPQEARAEERLILALDRALCDALEIAFDAGLTRPDGNLSSFELALVHAPEEGEGLVEVADRHAGHWRLNPPDQHNDKFAPLVRLMTGLWRRLSDHDRVRATRIASGWVERDAMIFKRLGAWAATNDNAGQSVNIERYLRATTRARYWSSDHNAELVRFYCRSWNRLAVHTRKRIEEAILAGMLPDVIQRIAQPGDRRHTRALYTARELARIRTAGGRLSRRATRRLNALHAAFPDLPRDMPIFAHLYSSSWSGSGYAADVRVLDEVDHTQLLASAEEFETNNHIEQADLWRVFSKSEPVRAFAALANARDNDQFPARRWEPLLSLYAFPEHELAPTDLPAIETVLAALALVPAEALPPLGHVLSRIIERHAAGTGEPVFPRILALWDQLLLAVAVVEDEDDRTQPLSDTIVSHPLASLAGALMTMQSNVRREAGGGFSDQFAGRFAALIALQGRAGLVARGALMQQLSFLHWLSPDWVDENLMPQLLEETDDALDLMSVVARSVAPQDSEIFNRLKQAIFRALEHERTDDWVRDQLSGALIGAALAVVQGREGFDLSKVECRRTLTRMPNSVLSRMAWELGSLLRNKQNGVAKAAYWDAAVAQFLTDYWPNDVSARTPEVSEHLVRLPALAGDAFERAVDVVLGLIRPIKRHELGYGLGLSDEEDLLQRYPRATLKLVVSILDRNAPPPSDISEVIRKLIGADPAIAAQPAFWRLRQMQRPN